MELEVQQLQHVGLIRYAGQLPELLPHRLVIGLVIEVEEGDPRAQLKDEDAVVVTQALDRDVQGAEEL